MDTPSNYTVIYLAGLASLRFVSEVRQDIKLNAMALLSNVPQFKNHYLID